MFQRFIDDLRDRAANVVRMSCVATAAVVALIVAGVFLCAAGFVAVQQRYGSIEACLTGALAFFIVALIGFGSYQAMSRRAKARAAARAAAAPRSAMHALLADPKLVAVGLQVIRTIGIKRLVPIVAICGVALGLVAANRHSTNRSAIDPTAAE